MHRFLGQHAHMAAFLLVLVFSLPVVFMPLNGVMAAEHGGGEGEKSGGHDSGSGEHQSKGKDDKDGVISGGRFAGDLIYVHMQPMIVPVINENGAEQVVTLMIDFQVKDFDAADTIHSNMPKVQDAVFRALYGGLGKGSLKNGHLVNIPKIKEKLLVAVRDALNKDLINEVLIQGVAQRML